MQQQTRLRDFFVQNTLSGPLEYFRNIGLEHPPPSLKMKIWTDLGTWDLSSSGVHAPTYVGAGVWRLIAVSPKDTVSLPTCSDTEFSQPWSCLTVNRINAISCLIP